MASELEEFTDFLFGKESGYVYAPIKKEDNTWIENFFFWPLERGKLLDYVRTSARESDCYISPVLHKIKSRKSPVANNLKNSRVVWVEFDGKPGHLDLKGIVEPNYIIQTSTEDHKHLYWRVESAPNEVIEDANRRLTYYLEADSSGFDISQVLRLPETINHKPGKNLQVKVLKSDSTTLSSLAVFDKAPTIEKPVLKLVYGELLDVKEIITRLNLKELDTRIHKEIPGYKQRSTFLMSTGFLLAENGCNHIEIVSILYEIDHRIKKFVGRDDQLTRLSEIAAIALLRAESDKETVTIYNFLDILNNKDRLEWLVEGFLHSKGLMLLSGPPNVGKTTLANDIIYHLTSGRGILGKLPVGPLNIGFISIEMCIAELQYFVEMQCKEWSKKQLKELMKNSMVPFPEAPGLDYIENFIKKTKPQVVIIDSLSELIVDGEDKKEQHTTMKFFRRMNNKYNVAFILIHHQRKASGTNKKPVSLSDLYGSFYIAKLSETVLCLWQDESKNYFELFSLKGRFNNKTPMSLYRDESLNYQIRKEVNIVINTTIRSTRSNPLLEIN